MANQEVHDFWGKIVDQYGRAIKEARPDIHIVGAIQGNTYQTYERGEAFDSNSEQMLRIYPSDIQVGDRVFVITGSDGGKYIGGKIFESGDVEPTINPADYIFTGSIVNNSPTVASTSTVGTYSRNIGTDVLVLPAGTWSLTCHGWGMFLHSSANGIVRVRLLIGADQGTALTMTAPLNTARTGIAIGNKATGLSGTITVSMDYYPNASGTAYAGGGVITIFGYRTA